MVDIQVTAVCITVQHVCSGNWRVDIEFCSKSVVCTGSWYVAHISAAFQCATAITWKLCDQIFFEILYDMGRNGDLDECECDLLWIRCSKKSSEKWLILILGRKMNVPTISHQHANDLRCISDAMTHR